MTQPKNYQSSSYRAQAAEFERQHGNMGTPESELFSTQYPARFEQKWTGFRTVEDFDAKFEGRTA